MQNHDTQDIIVKAIEKVAEMSPQQTDGKWLEKLTAKVAPLIREWDINQAWTWENWPSRSDYYQNDIDIGIDVVAVRNSDNALVAIQCKAQQLDGTHQGKTIPKAKTDSFIATSARSIWRERWIITNGDFGPTQNVIDTASEDGKPLKSFNLDHELLNAQKPQTTTDDLCSHCKDGPPDRIIQCRQCMQNEAVENCVRILRQHEQSSTGGLPKGQARGRLILPCGSGKTRVSLRIVEELTPPGELSIVLCPSIALVAQIRKEYLNNEAEPIRALAVCSDKQAGGSNRAEGSANAQTDPTADLGYVSERDVKGMVTTNPEEIAHWIESGRGGTRRNIIFGTYQSGRAISDALVSTDTAAKVLVCDEAHRTASLRRAKKKADENSGLNSRLREFTLCHDNDAFPATYRVYQTATPKTYAVGEVSKDVRDQWIIRSMDDERIFGVELYKRAYTDAVSNGWLSNYKIIAVALNDTEAYHLANTLAGKYEGKGKKRGPTTTNYLRGLALALAMSGATEDDDGSPVPVKSCIAFANTTEKSKEMAAKLTDKDVRQWLKNYYRRADKEGDPADFSIEHLEAKHRVSQREAAKRNLASATQDAPHVVSNVGIFGEGTDSPALSAVAFLEPRKSHTDVIQAVGRAMRKTKDKDLGYIICPIVIPAGANAEQWLATSHPEDGWRELGDVLRALRAHDPTIVENLTDKLTIYAGDSDNDESTIIATATRETKSIRYQLYVGPPKTAEQAVYDILSGRKPQAGRLERLDPELWQQPEEKAEGEPGTKRVPEPYRILSGKIHDDGTQELRQDAVSREKAGNDGTPGPVNLKKCKRTAKKMINEGGGQPAPRPRKVLTEKEIEERKFKRGIINQLKLAGLEEESNAIRLNLLANSGISGNRVDRDLNVLRDTITEAAVHLRDDCLSETLDKHFGLDNLDPEMRRAQADGCTIAALLMMNAAMLHQRISSGGWLKDIPSLAKVKNSVRVIREMERAWNDIRAHDFKPIVEPALNIIKSVEQTLKESGLERALRHIAAEAEQIAETYADMGADHAGPLFNRVMGNQASDGAFFTRPVAASIAARLTLDACGDLDWTDHEVWREHKTVDLACGSGTLLTAMLTDMKRRARKQGASERQVADLQKLAVEETVKGLDINPVSLQLAASQLTAGNRDVRYKNIGLHLMRYGPQEDGAMKAGTLELLGHKAIVPRDKELGLADDPIQSQSVWNQKDDAELEDAVAAAKDARVVIMNPPFTNRSKMGEKFPRETQQVLRSRVDDMENLLVRSDGDMDDFTDKNSIRPLFVALADRCLQRQAGVMAMINPTIALCAPSGLKERRTLAERYHIHTILTCHQPGNINMSQHTNVNESIIVMRRCEGKSSPTRFVNLDRLPADDGQVDEMYQALSRCQEGQMDDGWGVVSHWPAESIESGDWTPAIWRSPGLAKAAEEFAQDPILRLLGSFPGCIAHDGSRRVRENFDRASKENEESIPILESKGAEGQKTIKSTPDGHWVFKTGRERQARHYLEWASHLLITAGQDNSTARLTATASETKYLGQTWFPVVGLSPDEAKAVAVFTNSTPGRLQIMRGPGKKLEFPSYSPRATNNLRIPDVKDDRIRSILADCWERTKDMTVPQFRDGECEVRRLWDEAVAEAMGWDAEELGHLRQLLHNEPHVRGLGYGQYGDEVELSDRERFQELADQWENETVLMSNSDEAAAHPAHQEIVGMGEAVVPLILERMQSRGGHWFHALRDITGADPVSPEDRGNVATMQASWLDWGNRNGFA